MLRNLLRTGFVNKVFRDVKPGDTEAFMGEVRKEVKERLGDHLNRESLVKVKELIRRPERGVMDRVNFEEVMGGVERFVSGAPQREFEAIKEGRKRHKL